MTLEDLRVFVTAADKGSLSAAARALGCTQPAVSQHIVRLEKELGTALMERRPRGVALTAAGRIFYEHGLEGISAIDDGIQRLHRLRDGRPARLSISTGGTTVRHVMKEAVAAFRLSHPNVELVFHSTNSHDRCIDALRRERVDLAFVTIGTPVRGIEQRPALSVPWALVVPQNDPLADTKAVTLETLRALSFVRLKESSTSQSQLESALAEEGVRLNHCAQVNDWDTAILFVGMGFGYAITPLLHAQRMAAQDKVTPIPVESLPPVVFGWACRRWDKLPAAATDFVENFSQARTNARQEALDPGAGRPSFSR